MKKYFAITSVLFYLALLTACAHLPASQSFTSVIGGTQGNQAEQFNESFTVTVNSSGMVFVADARNHQIQKFISNGKFLGQWGKPGKGPGKFERPSGLAVDYQGNIFVSDYELDRIQKFTPEGQLLMQWGSSRKKPGQFNSPTGIAIDSHHHLYITDTYNHRVQKFDLQGNFLHTWGEYQPISITRSFFSFFSIPELKAILIIRHGLQ